MRCEIFFAEGGSCVLKSCEFFAVHFFFFMTEDFRVEWLFELEQVPDPYRHWKARWGAPKAISASGSAHAGSLPMELSPAYS